MTTQIPVIFRVLKYYKAGKFASSIECPEAKRCFSFTGGGVLPFWSSDYWLCPWTPLRLFDAHNNWMGSTFGTHTKKLYCSLYCALVLAPTFLPKRKIPSVAHGSILYVLYCMEADNDTSTVGGSKEFCERSVTQNSDNSTSVAADCSATIEQSSPGTHPALYFFIVARLMNGIGNSGTTVLSVAYIDENTSKTKSPLYIG